MTVEVADWGGGLRVGKGEWNKRPRPKDAPNPALTPISYGSQESGLRVPPDGILRRAWATRGPAPGSRHQS